MVSRRVFAVFAGVFEGGSGKNGLLVWSFCGQNVVECVVEGGRSGTLIRGPKTRQVFQTIF
jgi:hypothetical protein